MFGIFHSIPVHEYAEKYEEHCDYFGIEYDKEIEREWKG